MKYRIDTLHKRNGKECFMISKYLKDDGSLTINLLPGKTFTTREEAIRTAEQITKGGKL